MILEKLPHITYKFLMIRESVPSPIPTIVHYVQHGMMLLNVMHEENMLKC